MKESPIIFSGPMVRSILEDRKTQTRRVCHFKITGPNPPNYSTFDCYKAEKWVGAFGRDGKGNFIERQAWRPSLGYSTLKRERPFYCCVRFPLCRGELGAHPNGEPMGIPADERTRQIRNRAHVELRHLMNERHWRDINATYRWLARKLGISVDAMHFGLFDYDQCALAIQVILRWRKKR